MRYPVKQLLVASAIAACTTLAACKGGQSNANQGNPNSMTSDSVPVEGTPGTMDTSRTSTTSTGGTMQGADTTR
jgi:hypothetical protein